MRKILIISIIVLSLSSCNYKSRINGAGYREFYRTTPGFYDTHIERQHIEKGRHYYYYTINSSHYHFENETAWRTRRENLYDYYYNKAIEKGINPDWYIDRNISEDETNTSN
jgi:hypothetical protein